MAINIVTPPTGGAPLSTDDYDAQNNLLQALLYSLQKETRFLTEWDTTNEPSIKQGVCIQHGGSLYLVEDSDESISGSPSDDRVYVKLTEAAGVITASFVNSASGYYWSDVYNGFYHADGTQLLPIVLYLVSSTDWYKYTLKDSIDIYDITAPIYPGVTIEIGDWNMDTTAAVSVAHGLPFYENIRSVSGLVRPDVDAPNPGLYAIPQITHSSPATCYISFYDPNNLNNRPQIDATNVYIRRLAGSHFDDPDFDATSYNRGWVFIKYEV